jgi:hypothetical protein
MGKSVMISDDGRKVAFTGKGLTDSLKRRGDEQRQAYASLYTLLEGSLYDSFVKGDSRHPNVKGQYVYYGAMHIPGTPDEESRYFSVRFKVDEKIGSDRSS